MTEWVYTYHVVVVAPAAPALIAALDSLFPKDDGVPRIPTEPWRYAVKLSATGTEPATHYGSSFTVTEDLKDAFEAGGLAAFPGLKYWRVDSLTQSLIASNTNDGDYQVGDPVSFNSCVVAENLQRIQPVLEV
jgi:hypothetical protein